LGVLGAVIVLVTLAEEVPKRVSATLFKTFMLVGGVFLIGERDLFRVGVVGSEEAVGTVLLQSFFVGLSLVRLSLLYFDRVGDVERANCMYDCLTLNYTIAAESGRFYKKGLFLKIVLSSKYVNSCTTIPLYLTDILCQLCHRPRQSVGLKIKAFSGQSRKCGLQGR
jgi:hypothetical protein